MCLVGGRQGATTMFPTPPVTAAERVTSERVVLETECENGSQLQCNSAWSSLKLHWQTEKAEEPLLWAG